MRCQSLLARTSGPPVKCRRNGISINSEIPQLFEDEVLVLFVGNDGRLQRDHPNRISKEKSSSQIDFGVIL